MTVLAAVLATLRLRPPPVASASDECSEWELELRHLVQSASVLRAAVGREGVLLEAGSVRALVEGTGL